jgi:hypothetical protein
LKIEKLNLKFDSILVMRASRPASVCAEMSAPGPYSASAEQPLHPAADTAHPLPPEANKSGHEQEQPEADMRDAVQPVQDNAQDWTAPPLTENVDMIADHTSPVEKNLNETVNELNQPGNESAFQNVQAIADVIFLSLSRGFVGALSRPEITTILLPAMFFLGRSGLALVSSSSAIMGFLVMGTMLLNVIFRNSRLVNSASNSEERKIGERLLATAGDDVETAEWLNTAVRFVWRRYPELIAGNRNAQIFHDYSSSQLCFLRRMAEKRRH